MVVPALGGAVRLLGPERPALAEAPARPFERAGTPAGEHVADAPPHDAVMADEDRMVDPHSGGPGRRVQLGNCEAAPAALRETLHVVTEDVEPGEPVRGG